MRLLDHVYAPAGAAKGVVDVQDDAAVIKTTLTPPTEFRAALCQGRRGGEGRRRASGGTPAQLGAAPERQPLAGLKIALDPGPPRRRVGEDGGAFFQIGESRPVTEGDMTLRVAKMLAPKLQALGAQVSLVRDAPSR